MTSYQKRRHELLYSNEGRVEQCERILKLEKVAKELWLLLMFTGNDDLRAEIGINGKQVTIDADEVREQMVNLDIVLPQTPLMDNGIVEYLSKELGIEGEK